MNFTPLLEQLIDALRCLPGVGPKSAQRMAFHLLERQREKGLRLANSMEQALQHIKHCEQCRNFSEEPLCPICSNPKRQQNSVCIVETPADILAIEQTHSFQGRYFVLMGKLSPLDGIGPKELSIDTFEQQLQSGLVREIILATNTTVEGEATAYYIAELAKRYEIPVTRIAHGVPLGGELGYIDSNTLAHAFKGRHPYLA